MLCWSIQAMMPSVWSWAVRRYSTKLGLPGVPFTSPVHWSLAQKTSKQGWSRALKSLQMDSATRAWSSAS